MRLMLLTAAHRFWRAGQWLCTREKGSLETVFMQLTDHEEERVVTSYEAESGLQP